MSNSEMELKPIPPGYYEVVVIDDTTVEILEGEFTGRRMKTSRWCPFSMQDRKLKVKIQQERLDSERIINTVSHG